MTSHIFKEGELEENSVVRKSRTTGSDGKNYNPDMIISLGYRIKSSVATKFKIGNSDFSTKPTNFYILDVIISVGYRVKSVPGTQFGKQATER